MAAIYEFTYSRRKVGEWDGRRPLTSHEAAVEFLRPLFEGAESERLIVVMLNRKLRPIGVATVYTGTVAGMTVRVAELLRGAIRLNAPAILIAHNHPSGDPTASSEDLSNDPRPHGRWETDGN